MSAIGAPAVCQRVRAQVSLRLDSELSQLEDRMLELHLGRCAQCREYAADVARFTDELRSAPLEILAHPAFVERGRRGMALARLQGRAVAAAAAVAMVAIGVASQVASSRGSEAPLPAVTQFPTQAELDRELAILHGLPLRRTTSFGSTPL